VKFRAFELEDLSLIQPRDQTLEALEEMQNISQLFKLGPALTALEDDWPIGAGGIIIMKKGVGQAWLLASHRLFKSWRMAIIIKRIMLQIIDDYSLYRVHAFADCSRPMNVRFLEFLGMNLEGVHRKLGPDKTDFATLAWVR
jgi:hypothetical protein